MTTNQWFTTQNLKVSTAEMLSKEVNRTSYTDMKKDGWSHLRTLNFFFFYLINDLKEKTQREKYSIWSSSQ